MEAKIESGTLYLIPHYDLVADKYDEFRSFFLDQIKNNSSEKNVVLDAQGVKVIDSLGVNLIIGLYRESEKNSMTFKIINAGERFIKIAEFFKFTAIFPVEKEKIGS